MICKCRTEMALKAEGIEDCEQVVEFLCPVCGRVYKKLGEGESWSGPTKILNAETFNCKPSNLLVEG